MTRITKHKFIIFEMQKYGANDGYTAKTLRKH